MEDTKSLLMAAALKILQPLVRILIRHGVSHSEFSELARHAFVRVAFGDFALEERKQSVSRVAVLTGLSRKEVLRLKKVMDETVPSKAIKPINRATRVINGWLHDAEFCDERGDPRPLAAHGESGSFPALSKRYSGDIPAAAVLEELLRVGAVRENGAQIMLCTEGYVPTATSAEQMEIAGMSAADLLESLDHNLAAVDPQDKRFQRAVIFHDVPLRSIDEFKKLCADKSNGLLRELNRWLAREKSQKRDGEAVLSRVGLGIYYLQSSASDPPVWRGEKAK